MGTPRWDETWHRLREWTNGQAASERLAAQVLIHEGFTALDPSHPLGGKDGGKDASCERDGKRWIMAVYFPRGEQSFCEIEAKFRGDLQGAQNNNAESFAFVTNQELRLAERRDLRNLWPDRVELYHLERVSAILDSPQMASVRKQFLGIEFDEGKSFEMVRYGIDALCCGAFVKANDPGLANPKWFRARTLILGYDKETKTGAASATFIFPLPPNVIADVTSWTLYLTIQADRVHAGLHSRVGPGKKKATIDVNGKQIEELWLTQQMPFGQDYGFKDIGPIRLDGFILDGSEVRITLHVEDQVSWDIDRVVLQLEKEPEQSTSGD